MYKRIAGAEDQATLDDVRAELQDRYGDPPESVLNLLAAGELRLLCERLGIAQLDRKRTQIDPRPAANPRRQQTYSRSRAATSKNRREDLRRDAAHPLRCGRR